MQYRMGGIMEEDQKFREIINKVIELNPSIKTINQILRTLEKHRAYKSSNVGAIEELFQRRN